MPIWKCIRPYLSALIRFFHISYLEAKSQNRGSYLGILWVPLSSLIFSAMLALVFRHTDAMPLSDFFFYVLTGYIFWNFIAESITGSTDVIQNRYDFAIHNNLSLPGLFGKLLVDRLFEYFLNLTLLIGLLLVVDPAKVGFELGLFLPLLAIVVVTSLSTAYLVNLVTIYYPDTKTLFRVGTRFMFFVSPVFWIAAEAEDGTRALLVQFNPAAHYLSVHRQVFGIEAVNEGTWFAVVAISTIISLAAYVAYQRSHAFVRNLK